VLTNGSPEELQALILRLRQTECWAVIAGRGTGSAIDLHFGAKVTRKTALSNPTLSEEERRFEGEISVYVTSAWRLDSDVNVICGWLDADENVDEMVRGLKSMVGHKVGAVEVRTPAWDLRISFDNGLSLVIFADQTSLDDGDNYSVFDGGGGFTVGACGQIRPEPSDP
jgi:hypothetical protein